MKLGFVSAILPDLSLEQVFRFAQEERFGCVELMCWPAGKAERKYAGVTHLDATTMNRTRADEIRALCSEYAITISALGYYPNLLDADAEAAKSALESSEKSHQGRPVSGLRTVNTFVGNDHRLPGRGQLCPLQEVWPTLDQIRRRQGHPHRDRELRDVLHHG